MGQEQWCPWQPHVELSWPYTTALNAKCSRMGNTDISQPLKNWKSSEGHWKSTLFFSWKGPFQRKLSEGFLTFYYGGFWSIFIIIFWGRWALSMPRKLAEIVISWQYGVAGTLETGSHIPKDKGQMLQAERRASQAGLNLLWQLLASSPKRKLSFVFKES